MQENPIAAPYPISDFLEWSVSKQLAIQPKFQRRSVWIPKAKSYLIDTIIRRFLVPPLFIRLAIDPVRKRSIREVVDGQQRLRTVFGFIQNEFPVLAVHNPKYAGMYYNDLPTEIQKRILGYKFQVYILENISDAEVLGIFARMNTYSFKLNAQELRNAEFFGAFKQMVYGIALDHYTFWQKNLLSDQQIARMLEVELVSELMVCMLDGIRQTKAKDLKDSYAKYDDTFPQGKKLKGQFEFIIDLFGDIFDESLPKSNFKRIPLFYSLFLVLYDAAYGLPKSKKPRINLNAQNIRTIASGLRKINEQFGVEEPPKKYVPFIDASRLSTADVGKRRLRHEFLWREIFGKLA